MTFQIKFWGVRGSIACPSPNHIKYGGNTSCIEVYLDDRRIIMDAGTGIRSLGQDLSKSNVCDCFVLLTHTHWDHINGFPFFGPAYDPKRSFRVLGGHLMGNGSIRDVLSTQMDNPMFPVPLDAMRAKLTLEDFNAGETLDLYPDVRIRTVLLNHPNGATGYRIEYRGKSVCYVTDTEHVPGKPDQSVLSLIDGADLVVYDCTYTEEEFKAKVGWGHSTWNEGMRLCQAANAKKLLVFHHEPDHDDAFMDQLSNEAQEAWPGITVAREGKVLNV